MDTALATRPPRSRWLQFNLRTAFIVFTVVGTVLGLGAHWWVRLHRESWIKEQLASQGAKLNVTTRRAPWPIHWITSTPLEQIEEVEFFGGQFKDEDFALLAHLEHLRNVHIDSTSITLAAADRWAEDRPALQSELNLAETVYRNSLACFEAETVSAAQVIYAHQQALQWKLDCAPLKNGRESEKKAHSYCLASLQDLSKVARQMPSGPVGRASTELLAAAIAHEEMRLAELSDDPAAACTIGEAWIARQIDMRELAWEQHQQDPLKRKLFDVLIALQLQQDLRVSTARLQHNSNAEIAAYEATIDDCRQVVKHILEQPDEAFPNEAWWPGRFAMARTAAQIDQAQAAGKLLSREQDELFLEWVIQARTELLATWEANYSNVHELLLGIGQLRDLELGIARRQPQLAVADDVGGAYDNFVHRLAGQMTLGRFASDTRESDPLEIAKVVFVRRQLATQGGAIYRLSQVQLDQLLGNSPQHVWPRYVVGEPPYFDWLQEVKQPF